MWPRDQRQRRARLDSVLLRSSGSNSLSDTRTDRFDFQRSTISTLQRRTKNIKQIIRKRDHFFRNYYNNPSIAENFLQILFLLLQISSVTVDSGVFVEIPKILFAFPRPGTAIVNGAAAASVRLIDGNVHSLSYASSSSSSTSSSESSP